MPEAVFLVEVAVGRVAVAVAVEAVAARRRRRQTAAHRAAWMFYYMNLRPAAVSFWAVLVTPRSTAPVHCSPIRSMRRYAMATDCLS